MKRSHFAQGLLSMVCAFTLCAACAGVGVQEETTEEPLARLGASERSTAELGVATWEVRADGADFRVVGRDTASARQVEMIIQRDANAPDERVRIETVFPDPGVFQLTRAGVIENAPSDYLQRLGADVYSDLGQGSALVVPDNGLGSAASALTIGLQGVQYLGWNLWGYTVNQTINQVCPNGTTRELVDPGNPKSAEVPPIVKADYGAECTVKYSIPNIPTDCSIDLHMSVQNGHYDYFRWTVFTTQPPCTHRECSTGPALISGCSPCTKQICASDPFCCGNSWDSVCVGEVTSICRKTCS